MDGDSARCSRRDMSPAGRVRAAGMSRERVSVQMNPTYKFTLLNNNLVDST